ncbi:MULTISPECIES: hypothetical protein [Alteromonas]|jgi:hypothetical protein|uniref:hypothetical protein n=1 Tax=Alteromonas TaxID=226 RepID=UPI00127A27D7|nr:MULTISPECIES: hypothetical protein [Alteromonas]NQY18287.1 hypothetical protein [Alteromonas sp.]CAI2388202.1 hypothetical protein ALT831_00108 [Alteromonas macleodii]CAI3924656.1 hypothetical protein ALTBGP6_00108 [Alteromonas macleodii]CAI3924830.1 hypothetical protein ALTBGP14_00108 [Alteromonas macleodii]CAI3924867.1 hypothetical protein ALTBGP9_00108 [Alteromonas macleodii]|tara:strand:- start:5733 stop:6254 length:522 start_codon:yes stop_codon:yes gene_type:complete
MNDQYKAYSSLFSTVYDEHAPIGHLGRGTHYSIFRAAQFLNNLYEPQTPLKIQDFCVVWDEDHDTRVIEVIEKLYIKNLLAPVLYIGERKGGVTVILDKKFYDDQSLLRSFYQQIDEISQGLDDPWCSEVGYLDLSNKDVNAEALINDSSEKVTVYLNNINNLWSLGHKHFNG